MTQTFRARKLLTFEGALDFPHLAIDADGILTELGPGDPNDSTEIWAPAFFDIHVHGAVSFDFMEAGAEQIDGVGRFLASKGTAHYLATTVTGPLDNTLRALERLGAHITRGGSPASATPLGIHLEGPFLCVSKRGVHPVAHLLPPTIELFERFQDAAQGHIRLLTIAPEVPGALDLIRHATARGVRISLGHTDATAAEAEAAIAAGAVSATHTFNAMRTLNHREPGVAGVVLTEDKLFAEAIVDGIHVHPAMVDLWFRMKGDRRALLVTDGISATGMPDGTYKLGDLTVEVRDGVCLSEGGVLAGSVLTLDRAVHNLQRMVGVPLHTALHLASRNPAEMLGLTSRTETRVGSPANFNIFGRDGQRIATVLNGRRIPA